MQTVLKASAHDVRYFATLLRGVHVVDRATIIVTPLGITVTTEEARNLLATAIIFPSVFDEFEFNAPEGVPKKDIEDDTSSDAEEDETEPSVTFEVGLPLFLDVLGIYGSAGTSAAAMNKPRWKKVGGAEGSEDENEGAKAQPFGGASGSSEKRTGMRLSYAGAGHPLTLIVAEDAAGPSTTVELSTYEAEPHLDVSFDTNSAVLKIILKSQWLRDALSEVDTSCEKLTFIGNPPLSGEGSHPRRGKAQSRPMFRIQASGTFGSTEMDYPNDRDVLESFECLQTVRFSYRFAHILRVMRALQSSAKASLRINDEGVLSLQFLMPAPSSRPGRKGDGTDAFIEFRCLALNEDC
ncbi:Rad1-domain-containing protein [Cylindrobasidium torrendii FP15055 ss-10]|uniref:Rad1-domain-containing protein n=1 Tax=Cylindrobasidium torrendii FP15055 ss-10 TaxID=1314674 RepID=A0A0D7B8T7_9AGAR|nr:Rad1-domain-containing protein [Cylindrobasidium torrendii FP15055 ss-10]